MNAGGDPDRDDYELPWVDVEIPGDARALDREVQAYYRELRAQRWQRRLHRLTGPLRREGMVLPLLAGCLALTLLAGTLLTMFTTRRFGPAPTRAASTPPLATPASGGGSRLPDATVLADDKPVRLRALRPSVLALVPSGCRCNTAARQLAAQARQAGVGLYFVAAGSSPAEARALARQRGMAASHLIRDSRATLRRAYHPDGLTLLLVSRDGSVRLVRDLQPGRQLQGDLRALASLSPQGLGRPGAGFREARPLSLPAVGPARPGGDTASGRAGADRGHADRYAVRRPLVSSTHN